MEKYYRALLVDEKQILKGGNFVEWHGYNRRAYHEIKKSVFKALKCLIYAEVRSDMEYKVTSGELVREKCNLENLSKELAKDYETLSQAMDVNIDLLKTLVKIKIWAEYATGLEKSISEKMYETVEIVDIVENLYVKEKTIFELGKKVDSLEDVAIEKCKEKEKLNIFIEKFNVSFGFNEKYIYQQYREGMQDRIKRFYEDINSCYDGRIKGMFNFEKILNCINELDFKEQYLNVHAMDVDRSAYTKVDVNDEKEYIMTDLENYRLFRENENADELLVNIKEDKANLGQFLQSIEYVIKRIKREYEGYVKLSYWKEYDNFVEEVRRFVFSLQSYSESDIRERIEELMELFDSIDFEKIAKLQKELDYRVRRKKADEKKLTMTDTNVMVEYGKYKWAYKVVWSEAFEEIRKAIKKRNFSWGSWISTLHKGIISSEKLEDIIKDLEGCVPNAGNRFFRNKTDKNIMLMTYEFLGTSEEKYKRGAVVFDFNNYVKVANESKKNTWNGKADRGKETKENRARQYYQGRYLFANRDSVTFMCKLYRQRKEYNHLDLNKLKALSDEYARKGDLFDYRESNIDKMASEKYEKIKYGKAAYIDSDSENELVETRWGSEEPLKESAVFLYFDKSNLLSDYLLNGSN